MFGWPNRFGAWVNVVWPDWWFRVWGGCGLAGSVVWSLGGCGLAGSSVAVVAWSGRCRSAVGSSASPPLCRGSTI